MPPSETAPLNPSPAAEHSDQEENAPRDMDGDHELEIQLQQHRRSPLYLLIFYGISILVSLGGLGCLRWSYHIVLNAPFDKYGHENERASYEENIWGMRSIVFLLSANVLWVGVNLRMAWTGKQDLLWVLNTAYDFAVWAALIIFGVMNMVSMLWDRRLCDGLPPSKDRDEIYKKCNREMLKLLVVEMVAVNLGLLVAVLHFILLIARCCTQPTRNAEYKLIALRTRIREEEENLEILIERRRRLVRGSDALEWRRNRPLPPPPYEADALPHEENENDQAQETEIRQQQDDLIDMSANGQEVTKQGSAETPTPDHAATSTTYSGQ